MSLGLTALVHERADGPVNGAVEHASTSGEFDNSTTSEMQRELLSVPWSVDEGLGDADHSTSLTSALAHPAGGLGSRWTMGRYFATKGVTAILWIALLCGPIALGAQLLHTPEDAPPTAAGDAQPAASLTTQAGALAVVLVGAWLSSTADDPSALRALLPDAQVVAPSATPYRDAVVAEASRPDAQGVVRVVVAVFVDEPAIDPVPPVTAPSGATAEVTTNWALRYFQVAVATVDGISPLAEPALVSPPSHATELDGPSVALVMSGGEATAATLFLSAFLTGSEDVVRFTSPDAAIVPLSGAPYAAVRPIEAFADRDVDDAPVAGEELHVRVSVAAIAHDESARVLTYWLTLRGRDGRWEVAGIDPGPHVPLPASTPAAP